MASDLVALAIGGKGSATRAAGGGPLDEVEINGYPVSCGFVPVTDPVFEPDGRHRDDVLVDVGAFSCNYRDEALVLRCRSL